jgi:hypothetical protein
MDRRQLAAMTQTLQVTVPAKNAAAAKALLAQTAQQEKARVIAQQTARGGIAPTLSQIVDQVRGAPLSAVRPDGTILLEWGYVREVALVAIAALRQAGPRVTGEWANSLVVLADDAQVAPEAIPHAARWVHVGATVPYARRLEIGRTRRGDPFVLDDDDYRLIERTAMRMKSRYARVAAIKFTYLQLQGGRTRAEKLDLRYPAIEIRGWQVR